MFTLGRQQNLLGKYSLDASGLWTCRIFTLCMLMSIGQALAQKAELRPFLNLPPQAVQSLDWEAEPAFPNLEPFVNLVGMVPHPVTGANIAFTQHGEVWHFENHPEVENRTLILDIQHQCRRWADSGLVNLVFHPEFGQLGSPHARSLFVWYNYHPTPRNTPLGRLEPTWLRLSRFEMSPETHVIDPDSEHVLISQLDTHAWHSGGGMYFNPEDGFLYIAVGDEGGTYDELNQTQRIDQDLYSGILRIDVNKVGGDISHPVAKQPLRGDTQDYFIPSDNPWLDTEDSLGEFYAIGLRNPHRMFYDPILKHGWVFDVGQAGREEINLVMRGANYQWAFMEGTLPARKPRPDNLIGFDAPPVHEYEWESGRAIIGGVVYRGAEFSSILFGKMVFADHDGSVWRAELHSDGTLSDAELMYRFPGRHLLSSVNLDADGEILIAHIADEKFYRLRAATRNEGDFPEWLSETGAFKNLQTLEPVDGFIPYDVTSELWSDGAAKHRWVGVPYSNDPDQNNPGVHFGLPMTLCGWISGYNLLKVQPGMR